MRVSTAVRVASIIVVVKAVLIGVVCWRRAEMLYHPLHFGAASIVGFITVVAVAGRYDSGDVSLRANMRETGKLHRKPA
jgi:hypothetical protein